MKKPKSNKNSTTDTVKANLTTNDLSAVQEHYQDYPYPYRDPEDETKRLLQTMGEYLGEMNHYLYEGKEDFNSGFRCLVAGGGTGDSAIYLAEQLKDLKADVVYLDFSKASMNIAQKRAEKRGLTNITWVLDSILNLPNLGLGKFDYINCSGVLHHLKSPPEGLLALKSVLKPKGGMGIMIYGKYGRTGLYHVQELMRMVNEGVNHRIEEIMNAKLILNALPSTNWYIRAKELLGDHINHGDVGLYDMFLHKQDRAYSIPEMYDFVENAGLHFVDFEYGADRLQFNIENYITDFSLLQKLKKMPARKTQAICEIILGNIIKHTFYVSNYKDSVAKIEDLSNIPYFYGISGASKTICNLMDSNNIGVGQNLNLSFTNGAGQNIKLVLPISRYTKPILIAMEDESKSFGEIFNVIREMMQQNIADSALISEAKSLCNPLIQAGMMLLRNKDLK